MKTLTLLFALCALGGKVCAQDGTDILCYCSSQAFAAIPGSAVTGPSLAISPRIQKSRVKKRSPKRKPKPVAQTIAIATPTSIAPCESAHPTAEKPVAIDRRGCVYKLDDGPTWVSPLRNITIQKGEHADYEFSITVYVDFQRDWARDMDAAEVGYIFLIDGKECRIWGRRGECDGKAIRLRYILVYS